MNFSERHRTYRTAAVKRACGFTLIEVLVALVIMGIGLLGIAKMAMVSSHANDSAYMRSQATALGYEILDKMRANPTAAVAHTYDTALNAMPAMPGTSCLGVGASCSTSQTALWDVYSWKQHLTAAVQYGALPFGTASVVTASSANGLVTATITVQWDDSAAQSAFGVVSAGQAAPMAIVLETVIQ